MGIRNALERVVLAGGILTSSCGAPPQLERTKTEAVSRPTHDDAMSVLYAPDCQDPREELLKLVNAPEDIAPALRKLTKKYSAQKTDNKQLHYSLESSLKNGPQDSLEFAYLAVESMRALECKNKVSYKPRVMMIQGYAACIFTDEKGKQFAINRESGVTEFHDIHDASVDMYSSTGDIKEVYFSERGTALWDVEAEDLQPKFSEHNVSKLYADMSTTFAQQDFNPEEILPPGWQKFYEVKIRFSDGTIIQFEQPFTKEAFLKMSGNTHVGLAEAIEESGMVHPGRWTVATPGKPPAQYDFVGDGTALIFPYSVMRERFSPEQYLDYLMQHANSPEDVRTMINPPYLNYLKDAVGEEGVLHDLDQTFEKGGGDCDNLSHIAKRLLIALGKRKGIDYKPRIIGSRALSGETAGHGVCIFSGEDGKLYSIDQDEKIIPFEKIENASAEFSGQGRTFFEVILREKIGRFQVEVNDTLAARIKGMAAESFTPYDAAHFNPDAFFPAEYNWKLFENITVVFPDDTAVFYQKGQLVEIQPPAHKKKLKR